MDARVTSGSATEVTYEKLGRYKTSLKNRILAFIEKKSRIGKKREKTGLERKCSFLQKGQN